MEMDEFTDLLTIGGSSSCSASSPDSVISPKPKPKRRYTEKRRQSALVASRTRRSTEASLFKDLAGLLPVPPEALKGMDKLALLRVAVCYAKLRSLLQRLQGSSQDRTGGVEGELEHLLKDGFLVVMTARGEILYLSDNAGKCFRTEKHTVLGTSLYDHVDRTNYAILDSLLSVQCASQIVPIGASNTCAFKTTRDSATLHLSGPCAGQAVQVTGKMFLGGVSGSACSKESSGNYFVGVMEPLIPMDPTTHEFPYPHVQVLGILDWVCTADMRCVSFDVKNGLYAGYANEDLAGVSVFEFMHAEDMVYVRDGIKWMYKHGQVESPQGYRMLVKNGGWAWFLTQASTMQVQMRSQDGSLQPQTFCVGRHFMISDVQQPQEILAPIQVGGALPTSQEYRDNLKNSERALPAALEVPAPEFRLLEDPAGVCSELLLDAESLRLFGEADWLEELNNLTAEEESPHSDYNTAPPYPEESDQSHFTLLDSPGETAAAATLAPAIGPGVCTLFPQLTSLLSR